MNCITVDTDVWIDAVSRASRLSPSIFRVAFVVSRELHPSGEGQIHGNAFARLAYVSERTAQEALRELERRGFLRAQRRRGSGYLKIVTTLPV